MLDMEEHGAVLADVGHPDLGEDAVPLLLVDHLDDPDDDPPDADGHAQDRLGHVPAHTVEDITHRYKLSEARHQSPSLP